MSRSVRPRSLVTPLVAASLILVPLALSACGGSSEKKPVANAVPVTTVDPATAGTITGTITFEGTPPAEKVIDMKADPTCYASCKGTPQYTETAVVADGKVKWAFVRISGGLEGKNFGLPAERSEIDQIGCRYQPHVIGTVVGQTVRVINSDETLHNVHCVCEANKQFNFGMPVKGISHDSVFKMAEMVHYKCDVHPWMSAWIGVCDNPFFAVSGDDGTFTIHGVPPGTYTVEAWHETFGKQTAQVTVAPSGSATADFAFKAAS